MSGRAEMMKLKKALEKQKFRVERSGSGHWKVTHPDRPGEFVMMSFSPKAVPQHKTLKLLRALGYRP